MAKATIASLSADLVAVMSRLTVVEGKLGDVEVQLGKKDEENAKLREELKEKDGAISELSALRAEVRDVSGKRDDVLEAVERHDKQLRADNFIVSGVPWVANETEDVTKGHIERVLEEGMKMRAKARGLVLEAVRLGKVPSDDKKPRPIKVRALAGETREVLRRGKELKGLKGFEKIYVRPDRTPHEREVFSRSLKKVFDLRRQGKEAWVNFSGDVKVKDGGRIKTWVDVVADRDGAPPGASV